MTRPTLDSDAMSRPRYGTVHADAMARELLAMHQDAPHKAFLFLAAVTHNLANQIDKASRDVAQDARKAGL